MPLFALRLHACGSVLKAWREIGDLVFSSSDDDLYRFIRIAQQLELIGMMNGDGDLKYVIAYPSERWQLRASLKVSQKLSTLSADSYSTLTKLRNVLPRLSPASCVVGLKRLFVPLTPRKKPPPVIYCRSRHRHLLRRHQIRTRWSLLPPASAGLWRVNRVLPGRQPRLGR